MTPFSYKSERIFHAGTEKQETIETTEFFFLEEVVDAALGKMNADEKLQLIVRLKNKEDKDIPKQFPKLNNKGVVIGQEFKFVRRDENSAHIITDQEAIERWKKIFSVE